MDFRRTILLARLVEMMFKGQKTPSNLCCGAAESCKKEVEFHLKIFRRQLRTAFTDCTVGHL